MDEHELFWYERNDLILDRVGKKPNALYAMKEWLESRGFCVSMVTADGVWARIKVII